MCIGGYFLYIFVVVFRQFGNINERIPAMMQPPSQQSISGTLTKIVFFLAVIGVIAIFGLGIFLGVVFAGGF